MGATYHRLMHCEIMTKPLNPQPKIPRAAPRLIMRSGPNAGEEFTLGKDVLLIGRDEMCDVTIDDPLISRRHSQIKWDGAHCTLEDLGSTNGTFVNGQRLTAARILKNDDEVRIANVVLTFFDPQATLVSSEWPTLVVDIDAGQVFVNRKIVELSAKEYALLAYLYEHIGQICSKDEIASAVWPEYKGEVFDYQIESLIKRLRQKLEPESEESHLIATVRGRGYRLIKT
jgi:pSer/pThr/pTyr-binding forkhead associated (FHA) protein